MNTNHLDALNLHLSNERSRLNAATKDSEVMYRKVLVKQLEREVAGERKYLGLPEEQKISDTDLDSFMDSM